MEYKTKMTTIAYKDGFIAADGQVTSGSDTAIKDDHTKIFKFKYDKKPCIVAACGTLYSNAIIIETTKMVLDGALASPLKGATMFISYNNKLYYCDDDTGMIELNKKKFYAIGSGEQFAMGAMEMGASAKKAVMIASKLDPWTGGKIKTAKIGD